MSIARDDAALLQIADSGQGAVQPVLETVEVFVTGGNTPDTTRARRR